MSDAITLAAAAERSNLKSSRRGSSFVVLDWACAVVVLPMQAAWAIASLPAKAASKSLGAVEEYVARKIKREMRTVGRVNGISERKSGSVRAPGKGAKKPM